MARLGLITGKIGKTGKSQKGWKMEPIEIKESLKTCPRNEFREIMEDSALNLEERYTALYTRSLQPDVFNHYHPRPIPRPPTTWNKDYEDYKILTDANKAQGWRKILVKYAGYIKIKDDVEAENKSDMYFLHTMRSHFTNVGMITYAKQCEQRLNEFLEQSQATERVYVRQCPDYRL